MYSRTEPPFSGRTRTYKLTRPSKPSHLLKDDSDLFRRICGLIFPFTEAFSEVFFLTIDRKIDFFAFFGGFIRSDFKIIYIYIT